VKPSRHILLLCLLIFAVGNGCLSRSVVTQPQMTVDVVDDAGRPLELAEVRYYRWSNPHHRLDGEANQATDSAGQAAFAKTEASERVFPLCMHGVPEHHIKVCVQKKGHRTVVFDLDSPSSSTTVSVPLRAGESVECEFDDVRFPNGKERADIRAANVSQPFELTPAPPPSTAASGMASSAVSVTEAKKNLRAYPLTVWGFVSKIYTCPPCPAGAQCKPCMRDNIVLSEQDKKLESYTLADGDIIVFTKAPQRFQLGARVVLEVKPSGAGHSGEVDLVRIVSP